MIHQFINKICEFRQEHPVIKGKEIRSNAPILNSVKQTLKDLKKAIETKYSKYNGFKFTVEISEGIGFFPNILHLCILPHGQKVSNGIYVAICFDKQGRGILVGCTESKTTPKGLNSVKRKEKNKELKIDVDGGRPTTKYNDVFENPKEFYYNIESDDELFIHLNKSIDLCLYNLKLIKESVNLQVNDFLNSALNENELKIFDPDSIKDERKKIASQINARRGQNKFRQELLEAYNFKCAITGTSVIEILEAAHIYPYKGGNTNNVTNGILLRADIHTLFDLGLISINPITFEIEISPKLKEKKEYDILINKKISLPKDIHKFPSKKALEYHYNKIFQK